MTAVAAAGHPVYTKPHIAVGTVQTSGRRRVYSVNACEKRSGRT